MARQIIDVGVVPNDGTGDYIRDAFIKVNANDAELYAAVAALQLGDAVAIPPAADLNATAYTVPGIYTQATDAGAAAGSNYPAPVAGALRVAATADRAQVYQEYTTATGRYWRRRDAGVWSTWTEALTAAQKGVANGVASLGSNARLLPAQAPIVPATVLPTTAHDLNDYETPGDYYQGSVAGATAGANYPVAASGFLSVIATGTPVVHYFTSRVAGTGGRSFFRTRISAGVWTPWLELVNSSALGALNGVATLDGNGRLVQQFAFSSVLAAGADANTVVFPGFYYLNSDAQATAALNWPVVLAGTLQVEAAGAGNLQITQTYTTRTGTGGVVRTFKRVRFGTGGTWGAWQEVARLADTMQHGQCRFIYASATSCVLQPYNGNGLIINGKQYRIPAGGVSFPNTGLAANAVYYVFAKDDGAGGITLEAIGTGTTTRSTHTDGVEIRTGDPTRTLVGMIVTTASSQFVSNATTRGVAGWFNRRSAGLFEVATNSTTAATSYVKLTNGVSTLMWLGDVATVDCSGVVVPNAVSGGAYLVNTVNGTSIGGGYGYSTGASGSQQATGVAAQYTANADAYYNFAPYGLTSNGAISMTFKQDFRVMADL